MMKKVNFIMSMEGMNNDIRELKMALHKDTLANHKITTDGEYTIIEIFREEDKISSPRDIFYGVKRGNKLYVGRHQYIAGIQYNKISVYDEFECNGEVLTFN